MSSLRPSRALVRQVERLISHPASITLRTSINISNPLRQQQAPTPSSPIQTRTFSFSSPRPKEQTQPPSPSGIPNPTLYDFTTIQSLSASPSPHRILIDVREPSELLSTGRIPTAHSIPIASSPDAFFLSPEDFEGKYGFPRPSQDDEVIFYCKAGVRSRQAALLAGQAGFGGKLGNYQGSFMDWERNGGMVEKEGEQGA